MQHFAVAIAASNCHSYKKQLPQLQATAKVLTHQHPKPVAHPTMLDHVAMPDHVGNGEAGPLTGAGPVVHLEERPAEAAHVGYRTLPPSNRPSSKNPL